MESSDYVKTLVSRLGLPVGSTASDLPYEYRLMVKNAERMRVVTKVNPPAKELAVLHNLDHGVTSGASSSTTGVTTPLVSLVYNDELEPFGLPKRSRSPGDSNAICPPGKEAETS